jgi:hypothetical protein
MAAAADYTSKPTAYWRPDRKKVPPLERGHFSFLDHFSADPEKESTSKLFALVPQQTSTNETALQHFCGNAGGTAVSFSQCRFLFQTFPRSLLISPWCTVASGRWWSCRVLSTPTRIPRSSGTGTP